jgi:hypothetical protein
MISGRFPPQSGGAQRSDTRSRSEILDVLTHVAWRDAGPRFTCPSPAGPTTDDEVPDRREAGPSVRTTERDRTGTSL